MKRTSLIQLVIAIVMFAAALGVYGFWYSLVGKASVEAAALSEEIRTKSQDSARVAAAKVALESLAEDEAAMHAYLVREQDIVPFLGTLEDTGTSLGSNVVVASVAADSKGERSQLKLSLKITGSFDAVLRTLGAIEYGPYDSAIQSVTFDTVPVEGAAPAWTATATFTLGTQSVKP
jgi:flagellar basal body-associated protein FliL